MELFGVGAAEAFLVMVVTLIVVGPHRFPEIAREGGKWYKVARRYAAEVMTDVRGAMRELEEDVSLEDSGLRDVRELRDEVRRDITSEVDTIRRDARDISKGTDRDLREAGETPRPRGAGREPRRNEEQRTTVLQVPQGRQTPRPAADSEAADGETTGAGETGGPTSNGRAE